MAVSFFHFRWSWWPVHVCEWDRLHQGQHHGWSAVSTAGYPPDTGTPLQWYARLSCDLHSLQWRDHREGESLWKNFIQWMPFLILPSPLPCSLLNPPLLLLPPLSLPPPPFFKAFSISRIEGALCDAGQNYKNLVGFVKGLSKCPCSSVTHRLLQTSW